jgi:hypothetical protein
LTKKSKKRKLALTHSALVHKTDMKSIKQQLRLFNPQLSPPKERRRKKYIILG